MCGGFFANQRAPHASDVVLERSKTATGPLFAIFLGQMQKTLFFFNKFRESTALFEAAANLRRAGLNQPPARASTSGAWQDPSAPLPTEDCSGGSPAAGARLPSCCLSAMAVFALFRLPVRCELLVCHAIIHEQSTVQFLEVVVAQ